MRPRALAVFRLTTSSYWAFEATSRIQLGLGQALNTNRGLALKVGYRLIDHVHPLDRALPTLQVERWRISALPEEMTGWQVVGLSISIDDRHSEQFDVGVARVQTDRLEAAFPAAYRDAVSVLAEQRYLLTTELDPGECACGWSDRRTTAGGHAKHSYQGLAAEAWPRAVEHLDAADEAALAPHVERQLLAIADEPVDAEIFSKTVVIN